jgi:hypothetical protein
LFQLVVATVLIIVVVAGGGLALFDKLTVLDRNASAMHRRLDDLRARIDRMNVVIDGTSSGTVALLREQTGIEEKLARIDSAVAQKTLKATSEISLTPNGTTALRAFFKLTRKVGEARFKLGDKVSDANLKPVPDNATATIAPELKGSNFVIDQNGALVITAGPENIVVLVVEPTS